MSVGYPVSGPSKGVLFGLGMGFGLGCLVQTPKKELHWKVQVARNPRGVEEF